MNVNRVPRRSQTDRSRGLVRAGRILSLAAVAVGALVLAGWLLDLTALVRVREGLPAMNPLTAACFVLAGLAAWLLAGGESARHAWHGRWLAIAVASIGALRLAGASPAGDAVGRFLAFAWGERPGWVPMAPSTAAAFLLAGTGLAVADARRIGARPWSQVLLLAALAPALLSLALYLYDAPYTSGLPLLRPMAVHTAFTMLLLVCAGLFIRPQGGIMKVATGDSFGSSMFRVMLPVVVVVPTSLGALHLLGHARRLFDPAQGAALVATVTVVLLVIGLWFVARGLTHAELARGRAEAALAESRQRLDLVLRGVGVGVWDWDIPRDVVTFDDTVGDGWQVERGQPLSMRQVAEHVHRDDRARTVAMVRAALASGQEYAGAYRVVRRDGSVRVMSTRGFVTRDDQLRPVRMTGILWDTTLQHDADAARAQLQQHQLELKDQFLSHVSHELRSPLTVIYSFVEILLDGLAGEINEQQREFLAITQRNASQLRQMIEDLLEVTRAQTGKLVVNAHRLDLVPEVESTLEGLLPQAQERRIQVTSEVAPGLPAVLADPYRVRQVLGNLLDNALKFTPEGGALRVTVRPGDEPSEALAISVCDSGPGIPLAEREDIFRQLYQLDCGAPATRKGLGLGLFICRELVARMKGRIWVEGGPQGGSVFSFTLPLYSPASVIVPLLTPENLERGEFSLVVVTFRPTTSRAWAERDDLAVGAAADVIRSCTLPDRDHVLPRLGSQADQESVGVFACAGPADAAVLAGRIERQLPRCESLAASRLAWTVRVQALDADAVRDETAGVLAASLSSTIEAALSEPDVRRDAA